MVLGLEYDHRQILPRGPGMDDPQLRALTRRHKIPFYQDERVRIGESAAIVTYLAERHGGDVLWTPASGTAERAVLLDRIFYIMTEIDARLYTVRLHDKPPHGLSVIYGAAPTAVEAARAYVDNSLQEAARWLEDGRRYVMGERFGTPDILLASCLVWAMMYEMTMPPALAEYCRHITARPGFRSAVASNDPSNVTPETAR